MFTFKQLTETNGFDINNLKNARQNSYAWSMTELGDYIYVGTSRNMITSITSSSNLGTTPPPSLITGLDNNAEIWRYKKDDTCPWEKVFKSNPSDEIYGFRAMITHKTNNQSAIYAASMGKNIHIFKSVDGIHWRKLNTSNIVGTSSRSLASFNGKLYLASLEEEIGGSTPYLYSSYDPEFEPFKLVINTNSKDFISSKNPVGGIDDLQVFNNNLYISIATPTGAEVWRSNNCNPKTNDWSLVGDKGFGDSKNLDVMSSGVFKNHLYIAVTKALPLSLFLPFGFDLIRIDKNDNWELVIGGKPLVPSYPTKGIRNKSISGFNSGINNYFNVYGWQIKEFKDNLILTTYDSSTNISTLLYGFTFNKDFYINKLGYENYSKLINSYKYIYSLLKKYNYPKGFDIYSSKDGINFRPVILDGLDNMQNYGGRTLYVSCEDKLYLGTANPFCGLEVWKIDYKNSPDNCWNQAMDDYFENLNKLNKELTKVYPTLIKLLGDTITKKL